MLNDWGGSYPSFNNGGALSNKADKSARLVHSKAHIRILDFIIPQKLFDVINAFQKQAFMLNPEYKDI